MTQIASILSDALGGEPPAGSGAVVLVSVDGELAETAAVGTTARRADPGRHPFDGVAEPVSTDTMFDLASITKLFTAATLLLALDERGLRDTDLVADVLPEFRSGEGRLTTYSDLLRHTDGWPAEWLDRRRDADAWRRFRAGTRESRRGESYRYSCVGYLWAGLAVEALTGSRLDAAVANRVLGPLGMRSTRFAPPMSLRPRIAATENQDGLSRGLVHGAVHDETAWALGGVAGNAGMFGTAPDLLRFAELLRSGGAVGGRRVLPGWAAEAMTIDRLPAGIADAPPYGQALGPRVDDAWMGSFAGTGAVGHTGFTGTSLLTTPGGGHSVIILTNAVHPVRGATDLGSLRSRIADEAALH
jgi:CubicO group peptidase (beta-lactamase class C family)